MAEGLAEFAESFAAEIEELLNGTITEGAVVSFNKLGDRDRYLVAPGDAGAFGKFTGLVPASLDRSLRAREKSPIWLKVFYQLTMDAQGDHPAVYSSMFGWCVKPESAHCPIRVEYERNLAARQASHVQIDGESEGWAYGLGRLGRPMAALQKIHLPMGGKRFRPSLEDFIEFLIQESMVPSKRRTWQAAIDVGREKWENRQTGAAVRRLPAVAIETLSQSHQQDMADALVSAGWTVTPPLA